MYSFLCRLLPVRYSLNRLPKRFCNAAVNQNEQIDQMEYIKSTFNNIKPDIDWNSYKNNILSVAKYGVLNPKNIDSILMKLMVTDKKFDTAIAFTEYIKKQSDEIPIGSINAILNLYSAIAQTRKLTKDEKKYILDMYDHLYKKYKVLDFRTSECLIKALSVIDEWEKGIKVLDEIHLSSTPSYSAYSQLVASLFRCKKKKKAMELIKQSLSNKRQLLFSAYEAWVNYIFKSYKDNKSILKHLEEILEHIGVNCVVLDEQTAALLKDTYNKLEWQAEFTRIRKHDGQCARCKESLKQLTLTIDEFVTLQNNVKEKLIVGSDLFLKTTPVELKNFLEFVRKTAPYDIVIDALNVAYAAGGLDKLSLLLEVVEFFKEQNKKILVIGRKHMLKWNKGQMNHLRRSALCFFTENVSQDDPYFLTAAILSGPHADIVSKDLLRTHTFNMKDENLKFLFKKWQWQHQWMVHTTFKKEFTVKPPLKFTPCAQKTNGWHIPYETQEQQRIETFNDGTPNLSNWLCIKPKLIKLDNLLK